MIILYWILIVLIVVPAVIFLVVLPLLAYYSWAFITMWEWFVTPMFNIAAPSLVATIAFFLMFGLLKEVKADPETKKKETLKGLGIVLIKPMFIVAIGYFLKGYM